MTYMYYGTCQCYVPKGEGLGQNGYDVYKWLSPFNAHLTITALLNQLYPQEIK